MRVGQVSWRGRVYKDGGGGGCLTSSRLLYVLAFTISPMFVAGGSGGGKVHAGVRLQKRDDSG